MTYYIIEWSNCSIQFCSLLRLSKTVKLFGQHCWRRFRLLQHGVVCLSVYP